MSGILSQYDVRWTLRLLDKRVREAVKETGAVLAGGFIRAAVAGEKASDIDLFAPNVAMAEAVAKNLVARNARDARMWRTDNSWCVTGVGRLPIQVIHRWTYPTAAELIHSFDFTVSCAAIWYENGEWQSFADPRFYQDLASRRLVYRSPVRNEDAGGSMLRVLKFYQRGYRIPLDSLGAVIARLVESVDNNKIVAVAGATHESRVARVITSLLVMVDPNLDVGAVAHLPGEDEVASDEGDESDV